MAKKKKRTQLSSEGKTELAKAIAERRGHRNCQYPSRHQRRDAGHIHGRVRHDHPCGEPAL